MNPRPPLNAADRLDSELRIRLKANDREQMDRAAQASGHKTSTWARQELLRLAGRIVKQNKEQNTP